ncbi:dehydrodolichyl diphosphate synthase CPT3 isoform X2 [Prosopis cineraria]|uniref:dehydrodolichyl diphosphate synthase CPT3 isoform X2 n=1 Tax=Prosopis cineraria TaxID=364024 RepID=UPI0024100AF5|nr:dehydrodolichyl diphosphate synthase CPT3 isoform X2 [Prosopis cineraria]XP_054824137.1 dehydrodolichyl diphosphate synthase CPT3 isoform X2 [Prosopis cineraria]XP_054824138.1 dehydrodolichyl diphosphate synthase CPT3 isoform X2 [Prosopis cineraria]XP_054824139.1 dehydrodolichyl diphosphate synthase CPT3 isoform X2 [Prosopis cineraria]XP_054824140.1 dehydrodolichyl diphosphate synthase CPT3 isoform X2 [Prosopis cineraria]XP_054824141.1 dehydrodolichyl diphosphate synthase CPT3 isoform X2 [P
MPSLFLMLAENEGPVPDHIAFIMDGNRRYAKKRNMAEGDGHKAGFSALLSMLRYCYELGVKYVTVYAFSIDNFKRQPKEVQSLMDLMREKIEELLQEESIVNEYGIRLHFIGNLQLLTEPVRAAVEKAMRVTAQNNQRVLLLCVAYTSRDEIVRAVQESCKDKWNEVQASKEAKGSNGVITRIDEGPKRNSTCALDQHSCKDYLNATKACSASKGAKDAGGRDGQFAHAVKQRHNYCGETGIIPCNGVIDSTEGIRYKEGELPAIKLVDIEKHMYMAVAPDPDILIRSSGETRLSNFLLWQTSTCPLYAPAALWPEIGLRHLIWAVLSFQRHHSYLEKKRKQS